MVQIHVDTTAGTVGDGIINYSDSNKHLSKKAIKHSNETIQKEQNCAEKKNIVGNKTADGYLILPKLGPRPVGQYEKKKIKLCQFPGCDRYYDGTGFSKYCKELYQLDELGNKIIIDGKPVVIWEGHRHRKFRKEIDAKKKKIIKENPNQIYKHNLDSPQDITFKCDLCGNDFSIKVYPQIEIYPRFCESHRSEFRRFYYRVINKILPPIPIIKIDFKPEPPEPEEVEDVEDEIEDFREVLTIPDDTTQDVEISDMAFSFEHLTCSLKECLNYLEGNKCDCNLPTMKGKCKPNDKSCVFYGSDLEQDLKDIKKQDNIANPVNTLSNITIPSSNNKDEVKLEITHGGYIIKRFKSHSYKIYDSDGNIQNAKPLLINFLMELDHELKKDDLIKRGTRPLGNTFIRLKGIIL